ncbi:MULTISPECIES: hypothetical protein [unclassified Novosphingobium]|uniref:hypothetical protein n=1 Tax=unclassified Novosphingobium TaxID=2644732 RepID=UPI00135C1C10|nr:MULTISPECIES: hypothetical protein [unclassified Novosphingobium]
MSAEVTPGAWEIIKLIRLIAADDSAPDMVAVAMVQEIADIVDRARGLLPESDIATLVGIGAIIMKDADAEMTAMVHAMRLMPRGGKA